MKVVIDTSVWISALITKESNARDILRLDLEDKITPQMSEALFYEYEAVMKRKKMQNLTPLTVEEQNTLFYAYQGLSLNKLFDEFATVALAQFDAKVRFELLSSKGNKKEGLDLLDKLDKVFAL